MAVLHTGQASLLPSSNSPQSYKQVQLKSFYRCPLHYLTSSEMVARSQKTSSLTVHTDDAFLLYGNAVAEPEKIKMSNLSTQFEGST